MPKHIIHLRMMLAAFASFAEIVQIDFDVRDYEGNPISGVDIKCRTRKVTYIPYAPEKMVSTSFLTDRNGKSCARFRCFFNPRVNDLNLEYVQPK